MGSDVGAARPTVRARQSRPPRHDDVAPSTRRYRPSTRLVSAVEWVDRRAEPPPRIAYFGASTGAGGALVAAGRQGQRIAAIVSRGGRPDLAGAALPLVTAPTLLIVGEDDRQVAEVNAQALRRLGGPRQLDIVPGATHLFEEPGTLAQVAHLAAAWFERWLRLDP